jgi:hypothetical protein
MKIFKNKFLLLLKIILKIRITMENGKAKCKLENFVAMKKQNSNNKLINKSAITIN